MIVPAAATAIDSARPQRADQPAHSGNSAALEDRKIRCGRVAAIAAEHAAAVDRDGSFPKAAIAAARTQRLMAVMVPGELGGEGAGLAEVVDLCYRLGQACAATAMIYAMHQIMVACIIRHRRNGAWHERLLRRLSADQLLLASSTT